MQAEAAESAREPARRWSCTGATIPEGISQYNIVPGLLGVILQMTMVMMTSIALTRETERGTMENLLAMPASPARDHARQGAALSGRRRGAGGGGADRGEAAVRRAVRRLAAAAALSAILVFVLALVLLGYTISTVARTQMQAMQLTFFFFLPSILLSGFMFPYRGMPGWAQIARRDLAADAFPAHHPRGDAEGRRLPGDCRRDRLRWRFSWRCLPAWRCCGSGGRWIKPSHGLSDLGPLTKALPLT